MSDPSGAPALADVSRAYMVSVPTIVTTVIALILTALRMYVRIRMIKMVDWDDWFNLLAMVSPCPWEGKKLPGPWIFFDDDLCTSRLLFSIVIVGY